MSPARAEPGARVSHPRASAVAARRRSCPRSTAVAPIRRTRSAYAEHGSRDVASAGARLIAPLSCDGSSPARRRVTAARQRARQCSSTAVCTPNALGSTRASLGDRSRCSPQLALGTSARASSISTSPPRAGGRRPSRRRARSAPRAQRERRLTRASAAPLWRRRTPLRARWHSSAAADCPAPRADTPGRSDAWPVRAESS